MTSPRLSTVGTISAIEKALDVLDGIRDRVERDKQYAKLTVILPTSNSLNDLRTVDAARAELAELRAQPEPMKPEQEQALQALVDEAQAMGLYDKPEQGHVRSWEPLPDDLAPEPDLSSQRLLSVHPVRQPKQGPVVIDRDRKPPTPRAWTEADTAALEASQPPEHLKQYDHECEPEQGREVEPEAESLLAGMLMMQRRGNPDKGGSNWGDKRNAKDILEGLKTKGFRIVRELEPRR